MIRIRTPSRLHFGLLAPAARSGRRFGGVGLMIDRPGIELTFEPSDRWSVQGPLAERATAILDKVRDTYLGTRVGPHELRILHAAPEHMGLGTGTQLALAITRGLAKAAGASDTSAVELAPLVGRGLRSAIGTHGFDRGGFLVDGGRADEEEVAPLVACMSFPKEWRMVLILPAAQHGVHGAEERRAFEQLEDDPAQTAALSRRILLELLPALSGADFEAFGESLHRFNREAGEAFAPVQGGPYANARVAEIIDWLRAKEVRGCGQSSWGPTVFALTRDPDAAAQLMERLEVWLPRGAARLIETRADNQGTLCLC
jgi:beta-RFAP synthase